MWWLRLFIHSVCMPRSSGAVTCFSEKKEGSAWYPNSDAIFGAGYLLMSVHTL